MIKTYTRELSLKELKLIKQPKISMIWWLFENFILSLVFIIGILLILGNYIHGYLKWNKDAELYMVISIVIIAFIINLKFHFSTLKDFPFPPKIPIEDIKAEITIIQSRKAVEREDPEDFGPGFYFEIKDGVKLKSIFLCGQYLYSATIPNTHIEVTRRSDTKEILDIKTKGTYFSPEKVLPPFSDEEWNSENYHEDGDILNLTLDEIKKKNTI